MLKFNASIDIANHIENTVINTQSRAIEIITNEFVKDSNKDLVPKQEGILRNSALVSSDYKRGLAIWSTEYASKVYFEGSLTGVAMWGDVNAQRNMNKYELMYDKEVMNRSKKL